MDYSALVTAITTVVNDALSDSVPLVAIIVGSVVAFRLFRKFIN